MHITWSAAATAAADSRRCRPRRSSRSNIATCPPVRSRAERRPTDRLPPGKGIVRWREVFQLLAEKGYAGYLSYEAPNPAQWARPPQEVAREALAATGAAVGGPAACDLRFCCSLERARGCAVHAADSYPSRPVRLIIPFSAGGAADVPGRMVAQKLSELLGQQIVIDNRPGAGGIIGAELVAHAAADGYTLLMSSNTHYVSSALRTKLAYHPVDSFVHITSFLSAPSVLVVHPSLGAKR